MEIRKTKKLVAVGLIAVFLGAISSCGTSNTFKGGAIGAASGGAIGALIGDKAGNTAVGAIIGAAVGGTGGALIGKYMDKQAAELEGDLEGAKVERVGEGIKITFDSGILFAVSSSDLSDASKTNIEELAATLNKYEDTNIVIEGHTDSSGSDELNQRLSEERAASVSNYLTSLSVITERITTTGYGETQPVADNSTAAGKEQNRRVEIAIFANKKLQKAAERGDNIIVE